jgi:hypothetical protein
MSGKWETDHSSTRTDSTPTCNQPRALHRRLDKLLVQPRVYADDLPHRPLPWITVRPVGEPDSEPLTEVVFQGCVVGLRGRHGGCEKHPAVDRQPPPIEDVALPQIGKVEISRRLRPGAQLEQHRDQPELFDGRPRGRAGAGQLLHSRADEDAAPLTGG